MKITSLEWDAANITHIARHNISPEELEEAVYDNPGIWERGRTGRYYLLSRTLSGRYIFAVFEYMKNGLARPVTARDMTDTEHRRYERRCGK
ncbi:BrnT family toxin [Pelotomaculum isophthalicicum JI]|uniref:BrnT family toxin n=1 Tax=Pelotomaculum isophthalicicum JI TaxID=947010 RepID=A0A9X4JSY8_9FIRM|nr:BrnT family toxin [Pelotomaculum isophthalicicum]MDF9407779.1 BrnT family toxin [Pelotomaculum isophthalicicum JI]